MATYTLSYPGDTVQLLLDKINSLNYYTRPQVLELLEQYARMVEVQSIVASKQDRLVSGTNIKTVDGQSIVGGGNVDLSRFVTATANNLANYYLKSDVYTKAEVQQLISSVQGFAFVSAVALPDPSSLTLNKVYLVPSTNPQSRNIKEEFITIETPQGYAWEQIGSTAIDITAYSTTKQMTAAINAAIAGKQDAIEAIQVSIDGTSGTPSGSASISGNTLSFSFSGIKGNDGATGPQGHKGDTGETGATGPAGADGEDGADGKSAYQIWLDAGNQGTEADFLASLQGNPGSSQDYPFELENSLNGGVNKALTAEQGKVLDGKVTQLGQNVDNPEWVRVVTDTNDKILYGVKTDGKFYFGDGCPPQVVEYIQDKINELSLDEYEDIVTFLGDLIDGDTLANLLNAKLDKEGLDADALSTIQAVDNPEWIKVKTDVRGKIISGTDKNGKSIQNGAQKFIGDLTLNEVAANSLAESSSKEITSINSLNPYHIFYPKIVNMNRMPRGSEIKPLVLCHFSDIHGSSNYSRIMEFLKNYKGFYEDILLTGDIVSTKFSDSISFMSDTEAQDKCLLVIGNHDSWEQNENPYNILPQKTVYDKFFAPWIQSWHVTQPEDALEYGKCYYYKDYQRSNIRLIVADCMHDSQDQLDWVTATLNDAYQNGLSVIMSQHYAAAKTNKVDCNFQSLDIDGSDSEANSAYVNAVQSFIDEGGKFVCWLVGHHHVDLFGYLLNYPDQLQISIDCAAPYSNNDVERITDTKTQDCFNIYSFDTEKGIFSILRIGANIDRHCRNKDILVYDYANKEIIQ